VLYSMDDAAAYYLARVLLQHAVLWDLLREKVARIFTLNLKTTQESSHHP